MKSSDAHNIGLLRTLQQPKEESDSDKASVIADGSLTDGDYTPDKDKRRKMTVGSNASGDEV